MAATVKYTTHTASILGAVEGFYNDIEELASEMGEWRDNLEDKFSQTEKYSNVSECADALENITDNGNAPDVLGDAPDDECSYQHGKKSSSKSPYPRWLRRDNAVNMARAAIEAIEARIENLRESIQACDEVEEDDSDAEITLKEENRERFETEISELDDYKNAIEEHADEADGIEFPGAFN